MLSNTELLVLGIMLPYTIVIVLGIHIYEAKLKRIKNDLDMLEEEYFQVYEAYCNRPSNAQHYTQLQLDNSSLRKSLYELDLDNDMLKRQLAQARLELVESRPPQYESSVYQNHLWANQQELETEHKYIKDKT